MLLVAMINTITKSRGQEKKFLNGLFPNSGSTVFLTVPGPPAYGQFHPQWLWPSYFNSKLKKNFFYSYAKGKILWKQFLHWGSSSLCFRLTTKADWDDLIVCNGFNDRGLSLHAHPSIFCSVGGAIQELCFLVSRCWWMHKSLDKPSTFWI